MNDPIEDGAPAGWLDGLRRSVEEQIAGLKAQNPAEIEVAGRVGSMSKAVFDVLVEMKEQLNESSRAAVEERLEENRNTAQARRWQDLQYPQNRAILDYLDQHQSGATPLGWEEWLAQRPYHTQMLDWHEQQRKRDHDLWERYEQAEHEYFRNALPPNWNSPEIDFPALDELEDLQLGEGLPLAWVPPNRVLADLLAQKSSAARRRVIARSSSTILSACLRELRRLRSWQTIELRASASEAASAMKSGYWRAGQALAAIALDAATTQFVRSSYSGATRQFDRKRRPTPPGSSEDSLPTWHDVDYPRALLVLHSIYGAFGFYDGKAGEPVPTRFTRHGTIHSVSRRQYNKANALIALMHLVGLLCLVEDD